MSGISKRISGSWVSGDYGIMKTDTDTITTLPADIYANDTTATVGLKGQAVQSSTPSPTSPVMPQGCGDKTANLSDLYNVNHSQLSLRVTTGNDMRIVVNGTKGSGNNIFTIKTPNIVLPAGTYTLSIKMVGGEIKNTTQGAFFGINQSTYAQRTSPDVKNIGDTAKRTLNLTADTVISSFDITPSYGDTGSIWENAEFECMLYSGSDSIDYEPYGIKIPILSADTTTPVYLGEVESTRRIKKLVLTGEELFTINASGNNTYFAHNLINPAIRTQAELCTHLTYVTITSSNTDVGFSIIANGAELRIRIPNAASTSLADFKTYLQQQYAAGTPVCVWYVLATPQTAVVNEPLMRIGDYADTLSNISIPVTTGGDTLSVGTTVQPSEVTVNYKGWHPVADVHEFTGNYTVGTMQTLPISELETHTISDLQGGEWS